MSDEPEVDSKHPSALVLVVGSKPSTPNPYPSPLNPRPTAVQAKEEDRKDPGAPAGSSRITPKP